MFNLLARPSAGIGVVEVQKPMVFCDFCGARATLCGDLRGRGAKTRGFLRCLTCARDPLRGSARPRCKTHGFFFAISAVLAQPSAGIEVQKLEVFASFVVRTGLRPEPAGRGFDSSLVRGRASQDATCILQQLAQSNLRRASCTEQLARTDQFAESALPRATCAEQLTQSNLHRATCTEQLAQSNLQGAQFAQSNLQGATCRDQLAGATCAEQLAQSNLHSATCVEQLAQTNLHRPVCAEHLAWCCLALASRMLRVGKKNASCSVGPTSLAMFCFRANRGLVFEELPRNESQSHSVKPREAGEREVDGVWISGVPFPSLSFPLYPVHVSIQSNISEKMNRPQIKHGTWREPGLGFSRTRCEVCLVSRGGQGSQPIWVVQSPVLPTGPELDPSALTKTNPGRMK